MTPRPLVSWQAKITGSPAALERQPELTKRPAFQPPTTASGWLDSDSSSDPSSSSEGEADTSNSEFDSGGDSGGAGCSEDDDGVEEGDNDEHEEEQLDDIDTRNDGFSAADVDMYFAVIAEATEDELHAILHDEGLPLSPVRIILPSVLDAHDTRLCICLLSSSLPCLSWQSERPGLFLTYRFDTQFIFAR